MKKFNINGKSVVPLRAIPFMTGGFIDPLCIMNLQEDPESFPDIPALKPFKATVLGHVTEMHSNSFWLHSSLVKAASASSLPDAMSKLPAGVFVWEDRVKAIFDALDEKFTETEMRGFKTLPRAWLAAPFIEEETEKTIYEGIQDGAFETEKDVTPEKKRSSNRARNTNGINREVQVVADQLAEDFRQSHGRWPSKKSLLDDIAKSIPHHKVDRETLMREFKVTWRDTGR